MLGGKYGSLNCVSNFQYRQLNRRFSVVWQSWPIDLILLIVVLIEMVHIGSQDHQSNNVSIKVQIPPLGKPSFVKKKIFCETTS